MSDNFISRSPEPISITLFRVRNLKGFKGDVVNSFVKIEYNEKLLGESPKVECSSNNPAEFNFTTSINCTYDDITVLDDFSHKPFVLTFIEVLPKEKKNKDEKTIILGQCSFDILPLIRGAKLHKYTLHVHPSVGSPFEQLSTDQAKPEIDIQVSVENPLITEDLNKTTNIMSVTVESLFNPPDAFSLTGPQSVYTIALPLPFSLDKEIPLVFPGGLIKPSVDKEVPTNKIKWLNPGTAQNNAAFIPESFVLNEPCDKEDGDFKSNEDKEFRHQSETERNRITWNIKRNCFMHSNSLKNFQEKIAKTRVWPVEVFRLSSGQGSKGKKEEDGGFNFHGVAYVNFSPLLYPGVRSIRGAYKIVPYIESEYVEKTKRKTGFAEESVRIAADILHRNSNTPTGKKGGAEKGAGDKKPAAEKGLPKGSKTIIGADSEVEGSDNAKNVEGQQYVDAKSYIMIDITLDKPLVPKREREEMARRVAAYIPQRPLFSKRTNSAEKAIDDYHGQISEIANRILVEFRTLFGDQLMSGQIPNTSDAVERMRQGLMYDLNASGKYFAFKEQLKYAVIKIVREKYLHNTNFTNQHDLQQFLRDLFVFLVDQLQVGLSRVISLDDKIPVPPPITESLQLKHFACEAVMNENFEVAATYFQERIARDRNDSTHWFDYGTFCLHVQDIEKAEECFRECVSINQSDFNSLLMYGLVCSLQERHLEAETFLEAATTQMPENVIGWTLLGLFYTTQENDIGAEMALLKANKLNEAEALAKWRENRESTIAAANQAAQDTRSVANNEMSTDFAPEAASVSQDMNNSVGHSEALTHLPPQQQILHPTSAMSHHAAGSVINSHANSVVGTEVVSKSRGTRRSAVSKGKISQQEVIAPAAVESTEETAPVSTQDSIPPVTPTSSIFMQAAKFVLNNKVFAFMERALAHELLLLLDGITSEYYIMHACLKLHQKEFESAETSLTEALQIDHINSEAWAQLGHLKYLVGEMAAAKDCFERCLSLMKDAEDMHPIYLRLASIYLQESQFENAKNTFLMACKRSPSCVAWLGVGIACYRLDELSEAEDALSEANILNNKDPEVWAYLSLICLKTNRQVEAEQSYKYAIRVGLADEELLAELHEQQRAVGFGNPQL